MPIPNYIPPQKTQIFSGEQARQRIVLALSPKGHPNGSRQQVPCSQSLGPVACSLVCMPCVRATQICPDRGGIHNSIRLSDIASICVSCWFSHLREFKCSTLVAGGSPQSFSMHIHRCFSYPLGSIGISERKKRYLLGCSVIIREKSMVMCITWSQTRTELIEVIGTTPRTLHTCYGAQASKRGAILFSLSAATAAAAASL